jgi:hypothetical protein
VLPPNSSLLGGKADITMLLPHVAGNDYQHLRQCTLVAIPMRLRHCACLAPAGLHYGEVFERVALLQERPPIPQDMPAELSALMVSCWGPDPLARPTFRMIQQSVSDILKTLPDSAERFVSDL